MTSSVRPQLSTEFGGNFNMLTAEPARSTKTPEAGFNL